MKEIAWKIKKNVGVTFCKKLVMCVSLGDCPRLPCIRPPVKPVLLASPTGQNELWNIWGSLCYGFRVDFIPIFVSFKLQLSIFFSPSLLTRCYHYFPLPLTLDTSHNFGYRCEKRIIIIMINSGNVNSVSEEHLSFLMTTFDQILTWFLSGRMHRTTSCRTGSTFVSKFVKQFLAQKLKDKMKRWKRKSKRKGKQKVRKKRKGKEKGKVWIEV